jgi:hypothetical protein
MNWFMDLLRNGLVKINYFPKLDMYGYEGLWGCCVYDV